jgi:hypothetical protein
VLAHPRFHAVDRRRQLAPQHGELPAERRRHERADPDEDAERAEDGQRGRDPTPEPEPLQPVDRGADGEPEQHAEEDDEDERVREPQQLEQDVEPHDERRRDVMTSRLRHPTCRERRSGDPAGGP